MKEKITGLNSSLVGFGYFLARPNLWIAPLFATLLSFIILIGVFIFVAYFSWPHADTGWLVYFWGIFKSFGYASVAILGLWVSLFPIVLNVAFEKMTARVLHEEKQSVKLEGTFSAVISSIQVIFKTLGWRLFWPFLSLIFLFISAPLTVCLAQMGMGHIAIIDGCDLSLSVQGVKGKDRLFLIKKEWKSILLAGIMAGFLSMILTTTVIGWLFWLPGVYVGTTLWSMNWKVK
jgi:hypothetical protein